MKNHLMDYGLFDVMSTSQGRPTADVSSGRPRDVILPSGMIL